MRSSQKSVLNTFFSAFNAVNSSQSAASSFDNSVIASGRTPRRNRKRYSEWTLEISSKCDTGRDTRSIMVILFWILRITASKA